MFEPKTPEELERYNRLKLLSEHVLHALVATGWQPSQAGLHPAHRRPLIIGRTGDTTGLLAQHLIGRVMYALTLTEAKGLDNSEVFDTVAPLWVEAQMRPDGEIALDVLAKHLVENKKQQEEREAREAAESAPEAPDPLTDDGYTIPTKAFLADRLDAYIKGVSESTLQHDSGRYGMRRVQLLYRVVRELKDICAAYSFTTPATPTFFKEAVIGALMALMPFEYGDSMSQVINIEAVKELYCTGMTRQPFAHNAEPIKAATAKRVEIKSIDSDLQEVMDYLSSDTFLSWRRNVTIDEALDGLGGGNSLVPSWYTTQQKEWHTHLIHFLDDVGRAAQRSGYFKRPADGMDGAYALWGAATGVWQRAMKLCAEKGLAISIVQLDPNNTVKGAAEFSTAMVFHSAVGSQATVEEVKRAGTDMVPANVMLKILEVTLQIQQMLTWHSLSGMPPAPSQSPAQSPNPSPDPWAPVTFRPNTGGT